MISDAKIGNGASLTREIKDLLDKDRIDQQVATRLLLLAMASMLEDLHETRGAVEDNTQYRERYPSVPFMFAQNPKRLITAGILFWFFLYILASIVPIFEIQRAILVALGFPLP